MKTYESKLRKVDAIQWNGKNRDEVRVFIGGRVNFSFGRNEALTIRPLPATFILFDGDFLIKDNEGDILGMDKDDFERFFKEI